MPFTTGHIFVQWTLVGENNALAQQMLKKAVLEFDQDGVRVGTWDIDPIYHTFLDTQYGGNGLSHIAIVGDKMYVLYRGFSGSQIYEVHPDHTVRKFFDFNSAPAGVGSFQMTFDSVGHMYIYLSTFSTSGTACKIDKDTGLIAQQWTIQIGDNNPYDSIWLMDDDKTLLIGNSFPDGWEGLLAADLSFSPTTTAVEYVRLRSPYDGSNFGYYFDMEDLLIDGPASNPSVYLTTSPDNSGHAYDLVPTIRVLPSPNQYYYDFGAGETSNTTGQLVLSNEDEGFCLDCDPDGVGIWVQSQSNSNLVKFNKHTGAQLKNLILKVENGAAAVSPRDMGPMYFAVAGGGGHHGCGCTCQQAPIPRRQSQLHWIGV